MGADVNDRIRLRAYESWENEGRPDGNISGIGTRLRTTTWATMNTKLYRISSTTMAKRRAW